MTSVTATAESNITTLSPTDKNPIFITLSVMLATVMQALDTTIANVALPHMQGTMGATQDQIAWVLTSYIVAAAIFMPLTGFLTGRFGRKRIFLIAVIGFTIASMLCGAAQNLTQIVLFRLFQGIFGASLVPLSQSVMLDSYPPEKHASAMAIWGVGIMIGPILGPSLGGWLTEFYNWRWVFFINLPFGILAWLGISTFLNETPVNLSRKLDFTGFIFLGTAIAALQMMLDAGSTMDWFASRKIITLAVISALSFYLFVAHILTAKDPFIDPKLFADRNFSVGLLSAFIVGMILLSSMALLPPFMHNLLGYPVVDVGALLAPRGLGTMVAMMIVGKLGNKVDPRIIMISGLLLTVYSLWDMSHFNTDVTGWQVSYASVIQGVGLAFILVPLTAITFASLQPHLRNEGTSLFSLMRNIGSSIGISVVITKLAENSQANHESLSAYINPFNDSLNYAIQTGSVNLNTAQGLSAINAEVSRQASTLAYLQDFRLMMAVILLALPFVLMFDIKSRKTATTVAS